MSKELCEYIDRCPSASGWCHAGLGPSDRCIGFIISAFERMAEGKDVVLYVCDRRACNYCSPECKHTPDPRHAVNFSAGPVRDRPVLIEQEK